MAEANRNRLGELQHRAHVALSAAFDAARAVRWGLVGESDRQHAVECVREAEAAAIACITAQRMRIDALERELDNTQANAAAERAMGLST